MLNMLSEVKRFRMSMFWSYMFQRSCRNWLMLKEDFFSGARQRAVKWREYFDVHAFDIPYLMLRKIKFVFTRGKGFKGFHRINKMYKVNNLCSIVKSLIYYTLKTQAISLIQHWARITALASCNILSKTKLSLIWTKNRILSIIHCNLKDKVSN